MKMNWTPLNQRPLTALAKGVRKMFSIWLRTDPQVSWNKVVTCLTQASLENVAHNVEKLLLQGE